MIHLSDAMVSWLTWKSGNGHLLSSYENEEAATKDKSLHTGETSVDMNFMKKLLTYAQIRVNVELVEFPLWRKLHKIRQKWMQQDCTSTVKYAI